MNNNFAHLHVHSEYSLLDGVCRIKDLVAAVKLHGQSACAITDHGNMFGAIEFYKACKSENIKPIIGCEVYFAKRSRFDKMHLIDSEIGHLVLLCENYTGYKNLMYLVSAGYTEGFYSKPRIDYDLLREYSEGLIVLSGCLAGFIAKELLNNNYDEAKEHALKLKEIFKDKFYLELMEHNLNGQAIVNKRIEQLGNELNIKLVCTNDVHYINQEDSFSQELMLCIQTNKNLQDDNRLRFESNEFYLKSSEQMKNLFINYEDAYNNAGKIADLCNLELEFDKIYLPEYKINLSGQENPALTTSADYLANLCYNGFEKYFKENSKLEFETYKKRLEYELEIIIKMGYADYYLIVWDFINYARKNNIPVGPGRGSGAGSLAAFFIGITGIDPLKYNLIFERFLNPERVSMPDFDIDICQERRGEVINYVIQKYGINNTAHIITFGTLAAKAAVRDVGRAMGFDLNFVDSIAKLIPNVLNISLNNAIKDVKKLSKIYENDVNAKNLIDNAIKLEGLPRHISTHAAGLVIANSPVYEYVPIALSSGERVTQYDMNAVADLGLLKIDFLGLRFLTIIEKTCRNINKNNLSFDINKIDLSDKNIYNLFAKGQTDGVFQFEAQWVKNTLIGLKPDCFEDIIATLALIRPGPMDFIPVYIKNRHNKSLINYKTPELKNILEVTYGCIIYQEQVMQICRELAGYSYGRADIVRKAMSKKDIKVMAHERENFLNGCENNNISRQVAEEIFDIMSEFAKYAFNKSHAAAYALISYRTAYLKYYYASEFLSALMSSVMGDFAKINEYAKDCLRLNIKILPPDINLSESDFCVEILGDNALVVPKNYELNGELNEINFNKNIRFGLSAIKNVGENFVKFIINEREINGKFKNFADFLKRVANLGSNEAQANKRQLEFLIKCGAFDCFVSLGEFRSRLLASFEEMLDSFTREKRVNIEGQLDLFSDNCNNDDVNNNLSLNYSGLLNLPELSINQKRDYEIETCGFVFTQELKQPPDRLSTVTPFQKGTLNGYKVLYLKVQEVGENVLYKKLINLIEIFEGRNCEVKIYEEMTGKVFKGVKVDLNGAFLDELKCLLGDNCVKLK